MGAAAGGGKVGGVGVGIGAGAAAGPGVEPLGAGHGGTSPTLAGVAAAGMFGKLGRGQHCPWQPKLALPLSPLP